MKAKLKDPKGGLTPAGRKEVPPLTKNGKPTRYALAARAWGESAPSTLESVRKLYRKGLALLERYRRVKGKE